MVQVVSRKLLLRQLLCGTLLLVVTSCGQGGPEVAPVKGRVTLDGRPLAMADITFQPASGDRPSTARTDADGLYELMYKRGLVGARTGEHTVRIDFSTNIVAKPPNVPARYNTASELHRDVKSGENQFDFELTTDKK